MKYSALEIAFLDFSKIAINYMKARSPNGKVEKRKVKRTIFSDKQVKDVEVEMYLHWQYFELGWEKELHEFEETHKYLEAQNKVIKRDFEFPLYLIIAPLLNAVAKEMSFDVSERFLVETHRIHNAYWVSDECVEYHYIPLLNFSTQDVFQINEYLEIQEFNDEFKSEFAFFYTSPSNSFDLNLYDLWHTKYLIKYKNVWKVGEEKGYGANPLLALLSSLRLLQHGNVGTKSRLMKSGGPEPHGITGPSGGPVYDFITFRSSSNYHLLSEDMPKVIKLFNSILEIVNSDKYKGVRTSLSRLHLSYSRSHLTDKIVDYSIALESLLLSENNTELLYRMSMRASWLLRKNFAPKEIKTKMQAFYDMRSCIVHRGYSVGDLLNHRPLRNKLSEFYTELDEKALTDLSENLVKKIIIGYLEMLKNQPNILEINKQIDAGIMNW